MRAARIILAASMRGIRPEPRAARAILAQIEDGAVGREQAHADLEVPRPAFDQGVDRLEQNLHALGGDRLGDARELGIELRRRACRGRGRLRAGLGCGRRPPRRHLAGRRGGDVGLLRSRRCRLASRPVHRAGRRLQRLDRAADHGLGVGGALARRRRALAAGRGVELVGELLDQVLDQLDAHLGLRSVRLAPDSSPTRSSPADSGSSGCGPSRTGQGGQRGLPRGAEIERVGRARLRQPVGRPRRLGPLRGSPRQATSAVRRRRHPAHPAGAPAAAEGRAAGACACRRPGQQRPRGRQARASGAPADGTTARRRRRRAPQPSRPRTPARSAAAARPLWRTTAPSPRTPRRHRCSAGCGAGRRQERRIAVSLRFGSHARMRRSSNCCDKLSRTVAVCATRPAPLSPAFGVSGAEFAAMRAEKRRRRPRRCWADRAGGGPRATSAAAQGRRRWRDGAR